MVERLEAQNDCMVLGHWRAVAHSLRSSQDSNISQTIESAGPDERNGYKPYSPSLAISFERACENQRASVG